MALQRVSHRQVGTSTEKYETLEEQLHGMSKPWYEFKRPTEGQTNITLGGGMRYQLGSGQLKVHLNSMLVEEGLTKDYQEITEAEIKFNYPLEAGDVVLLRVEGAGGGVSTSDHAHYNNVIVQGATDGLNKVFMMPHIPRNNTTRVFVNGVRQHPNDYVVTLNRVEFITPPVKGSRIWVDYVV